MSASIEGIDLENVSVSHQPIPFFASDNVSGQVFFHYFCLMTTNRITQPHLNTLNTLFNCFKTELYFYDMSNIWENTDVCDEQYLFATEIYLL